MKNSPIPPLQKKDEPVRAFIGTEKPLERLGLQFEHNQYGVSLRGERDQAEFSRRSRVSEGFIYKGSGTDQPDITNPLDYAESQLRYAKGPDVRKNAADWQQRRLDGPDALVAHYADDSPWKKFMRDSWAKTPLTEAQRAFHKEALRLIESGEARISHEGQGAVYTVELAVPIERFVSHNLLLRQQPEFMEALKPLYEFTGAETGNQAFEKLQELYGEGRCPAFLNPAHPAPLSIPLERAIVEYAGFAGMRRQKSGGSEDDSFNIYPASAAQPDGSRQWKVERRWKVGGHKDSAIVFRAKTQDEAIAWVDERTPQDFAVYDLDAVRITERNGVAINHQEVLDTQLQQLWEKGKKAWADVPNASQWVEELRGNAPEVTAADYLPGAASENDENTRSLSN